MKIILTDNYNLFEYILPNKVEDSYTIKYCSLSGVEETLIINSDNNKWIILGNNGVTLVKGTNQILTDEIKDGNIYKATFNGSNITVMLFCYDIPITYFNYEIGNKTEITFGREKCDVTYDNVYVANKEFKIYKNDNNWVYEDNGMNDANVYLNDLRTKKAVLSFGDSLFCQGFKLIWMGTFIKINNPSNSVRTSLEAVKTLEVGNENTFNPASEAEKNVVLYTDNQTFFHTPRIKSTIVEKTIKISNPPSKKENNDPPILLSLGPVVMMGLSSCIPGFLAIFSIRDGEFSNAITEIIVCVLMLAGCAVFPFFLAKFNRKKFKKEEEKRQTKYSEYLKNKKTEISSELEKQTKILYENNLSIEQCENAIVNKANIWNREIQDNDFLTIKLGIGNKKAQIKIEATLDDFSLEDDNLRTDVSNILATPLVLNDIPITISLTENNILPLIIENDYAYKQQIIDSIILQLMTYYSGTDLKIIILTNEKNKKSWEYLKYTPYCTNSTQDRIFFAIDEDEMLQISLYLEDIYKERFKSKNINNDSTTNKDQDLYKLFNEYYLIITDDFVNAKKLEIIKCIVKDRKNIGFSLLTIEPSMKNVPSGSNKFIKISNTECVLSDKEMLNEEHYTFKPELMMTNNIDDYANIVANIPVSYADKISMIPMYLEFLEMYKVGKIEQLNIANRWLTNDPTVSLAAQVGIDEEGKPLYLDLHEKFHGPHGLIAGSTGSGKSEFIITYILSMAINYHPYEVQFVIIDYKGGGLAGAFENRDSGIKIPHLVGTITNLDGSEMNRTLVSIKSELQRRQILFNEARNKLGESTVDIYKYQKFYRNGLVDTPISHLFIISDEFAELKSQQPEFMNELISTARIGRSLGVHLILATQKPSGVVDDQIWSNSRFKVCLKVQTESDSNELLKRPDAASIKETGRFYLQIGFDELFILGQSAWAGAKYFPTEKMVKNIDDSIKFVDNNGNVFKQINDAVKENIQKDNGDQLTNIVKSLFDIAEREQIKPNYLWLPSIPKEIFIADLAKKYGYNATPFVINPVLGEYDMPAQQLQKLMTVNFTENGNLIVYGKTGSGKENLLQSLIFSICLYHSSKEINIYVIDLGAETLNIFRDYPQVGDVFLSNDLETVDNLFKMLSNEMNRRKELFSHYGGNYNSYIRNDNVEKLPAIITVLNGFEAFMEGASFAIDSFTSLARDASKFGIYFALTVVGVNNIPLRISQLFSNILTLQLADPLDYRFTFNAPEGLVPAKYFGRGLVVANGTAYEFQTAYIYLVNEINQIIKSTATQLQESDMPKARKVPIIPNIVTTNNLLSYISSIMDIPVGINTYDGEVVKYDFTTHKITTILGTSLILKNKFIKALIEILNSIPDIQLKVLDFSDSLKNLDTSINYSNDDFTNCIKEIKEREADTKCKNVYLMNGIGYLNDKVLDEGVLEFGDIIQELENFTNSYFIFSDNLSTYKKLQNMNWYNLIDKSNGIWVGENIENQNVYTINNLTTNDINNDDETIIYVIENGNYVVAKGVTIEGDDFY